MATRASARLRSSSNVHTAHVVTYNILSQKLARAEHFTDCTAAALKPKPRLELVKAKLEEHTARGALICLQEVSQTWGGSLHAWFAARGYHFVLSCYGSDFSDYMGVGVAFPLAHRPGVAGGGGGAAGGGAAGGGAAGGGYLLEAVDIKRIGDTLPRARRAKGGGGGGGGALATLASLPLISHAGSVLGAAWAAGGAAWSQVKRRLPKSVEQALDKVLERPRDPLGYSRGRKNTCVSVLLRPVAGGSGSGGSGGGGGGGDGDGGVDDQSGCFWFSTYHMPCAFWAPPIMTVHAALVAQHVQKLAAGGGGDGGGGGDDGGVRAPTTPLILAGDFNFYPKLPQYELYQRGSLEEGHPACPQSYPEGLAWRPTLAAPLASAYALRNGEEPAFTNFCISGHQTRFEETLDYIFVSEDSVGVTATTALPSAEDYADVVSLPTEEEPSDHLLIGATLEIALRP